MASSSAVSLQLKQHSATPVGIDGSEFVQFIASMRLPLSPVWAGPGGHKMAVEEVLASWVMRYLPPLKGVLLSFEPTYTFRHSATSFPSTASPFDAPRRLNEDGESESDEEESQSGAGKQIRLVALPMVEGSAFSLPWVRWKGLVWRPRIGQTIVGSPSLSTPSHISLLLHNLFNASIPVSHIPSSSYYFDSSYPVPEAIRNRQKLTWPTAPPENEAVKEAQLDDPSVLPPESEKGESEDEEDEAEKLEAEKEVEEDMYKERGWWRHKTTDEPLGGEFGRIQFTIVDLTIANSMISITGSLLADPFAQPITPAVPKASKKALKRKRAPSASSSDSDDDSASSDDDEGDLDEDGQRKREPTPVAPPTIEKGKKGKKEKGKAVEPKEKKAKKA